MMSKWISADSIINKFNSHVGFTTCADVERAIKLIQDEPSVDIVRCGECKYKFMHGSVWECLYGLMIPSPDGFCSYGERGE